jgi:predicted nucleic acid-binding protein
VPHFVDSNVLIYFRDSSDPAKQQRAQEWLGYLADERRARTSFQVLHEFYVTVTRKLRPPIARNEARQDIRDYLVWRPLPLNEPVLLAAWGIEDRYGLSFWDSLIIGAARVLECEEVVTEDLQDGQDFGGTVVVNPFLHAPGEGVQ